MQLSQKSRLKIAAIVSDPSLGGDRSWAVAGLERSFENLEYAHSSAVLISDLHSNGTPKTLLAWLKEFGGKAEIEHHCVVEPKNGTLRYAEQYLEFVRGWPNGKVGGDFDVRVAAVDSFDHGIDMHLIALAKCKNELAGHFFINKLGDDCMRMSLGGLYYSADKVIARAKRRAALLRCK